MSTAEGAAAADGKPLFSHHTGDTRGPRFRNPWSTYEQRGLGDVIRWLRQRRQQKVPTEGWLRGNRKPTPQDYSRAFPLAPVDTAALAAPPGDAVQAVWVGHATLLVQMGGFTFLTDPVFSKRCAPVQFIGPKRVVPPALTVAQLPERLDFVLLSHNHYDHLDTTSVRDLNRRYGKRLAWYVPLGLRGWLAGEQVERVAEMDWWQAATHAREGGGASATITMVPAQHWSKRGAFDDCHSLWGGYVVEAAPLPYSAAQAEGPAAAPSSSPAPAAPAAAAAGAGAAPAAAAAADCKGAGGSDGTAAPAAAAASAGSAAAAAAPVQPLRFYFAGDTGYCPVFSEIGQRLGPIDLAAIPIGAYEPRWFMRPQHIDPDEALRVAIEVRARVSVGIHCATWALTDEALDEPPARLMEAVRAAGLPPASFVTLQHGEKAVVRGGALANSPRTLPVKG